MKKTILGLDENYVNEYFRLLTVFGMWNPFGGFEEKARLYTYYAIALYCLGGLTPSTGEIIHAWKSRDDVVKFTQHFTLVTAMMSTMAKFMNLWRRRKDLEIAIDLLNWERRQPCNKKFAIYRDEIIVSAIRACRLFSLTFIGMVIWYCSFSYVKDLIYNNGDVNNLSISPLLSSHLNETSYALLFVIDKIVFSYIAGCTVCHDIFFVVFLIHVSAQLDLLKHRLQSCQDKNSSETDFVKDYDPYELQIECICRTSLQESTLDPIVELHTCIAHHQQIMRYVNLVQSVFNITLLLQFATSLFIITMTGFQVMGERKLNSNELIDTINFMVCALFQLFLYCWFGTDIIVKSESISLSAYYSRWYLADHRFKKALSIVLCRGQIPIIFKAGYICELSSTTFMNVISKCYSSMALLNQVNE